ncbi:MAG: virulence protein RhuM/Fic/DOC family protein [Candidatus Marinimicrobia bacterium]|jgi:prophage maintenance system killer protein|nr:virulence protein RhuM/Fic/DOC family protein [Candidatus Neomarinimicrobiota bacterium]
MEKYQEQKSKGKIVIYKSEDGKTKMEVKLKEESVWLNLIQMKNLFHRDKSVISRHINNIYKRKELKEESTVANFATVQNEGGRIVKRNISHYNLDMIISVGYRVNSIQGTNFRIWATKIIKEHIIKGFTINQKRIKEKGLNELEQVVKLIKRTYGKKALTGDEAHGLLKVITEYSRTWILLQRYDEKQLDINAKSENIKYSLNYSKAIKAISKLKEKLIINKEASDIFGRESGDELKGILGNINQTFNAKELYPSIEEKAAHLLYFIIKDHPFVDGNKRIASLLFILYLVGNEYLYKITKVKKI